MEIKRNRPFYNVLTNWQKQFANVKHITPKYCAISQLIINDIENGTFKNGDRLPPHRNVADALDVSIQTISNAYRELEHQGYLHARVGQGSFVFKQVTSETSKYIRDQRESGITDLSVIRAVYSSAHDDYMAQAFKQLAEQHSYHSQYQYEFMRACRPIAGLGHHRETLARYLQPLLPQAHQNNIIITNGTSQGIFLALASIVRPDDIVLTEQLTDHGVIGCSRLLRYSLHGLPIDEYGIIPDAFEEACKHDTIKALVCTPNFNNPTSAVMPLSRREQIAQIAARYNVYIIEDDVYGNLLHKPIPPISALLPHQSFYCSSLSKTVMTGMRIGYMVNPNQFQLRAESVLKVSHWMATPLLAEILCRFIEDGTLTSLIQLQHELIANRQHKVAEMLGQHIKNHQQQALSFWLNLPDNWEPMAFTKRLYEQRIAVSTPDPFMVESVRDNAVRVCIGSDISAKQLNTALSSIRALLDNQPSISSAWY